MVRCFNNIYVEKSLTKKHEIVKDFLKKIHKKTNKSEKKEKR